MIKPADEQFFDQRPRGATLKETAAAAALLMLSLLVFFGPAVFSGRMLSPADLIFGLDPLWKPLAPEGYMGPSNHILSDQVFMYLPWEVFARRSLVQGQMPLWNPYINSGQPFLGNFQSALFDPLHLLTYAVPLHLWPISAVILRLFTAGIFTFLFVRELNLHKSSALLAMMAFVFSGPMIGWAGYPPAAVMAWFPAMLWATERALVTKRALYLIASGVAIGAQFLGGHPETSFLILLAWAAYALYRAFAIAGWRTLQLGRLILRITGAALIGGLLAAVALLPFVDALLQSGIVSTRQTEIAARTSSLFRQVVLEWHQWPTIVTALLPDYFGTPLNESYLYPYSNYVEQNVYAGILPLGLAIAVAVYHLRPGSPHRQHALFFGSLAALSLAIALGFPFVNGINYLPLFKIAANRRFRLVYVFGVAILAGLGLERIREARFRKLVGRLLMGMALCSLVLIAATYVGLIVFRERIVGFGRAYIDSQWGTPYYAKPIEHYYQLVETRYNQILLQLRPSNLTMYLPLGIASLWYIISSLTAKLGSASKVWALAALSLTILDTFATGMPFNPTIVPEQVFPEPEAIRFLKRDPSVYRVVGMGLILYPNSSMIFGLSDIRGYETTVPKRYEDLVARMQGHYRLRQNSLFTKPDSPLLDLLNVKYVLTDQELDGKWEQVYQDAGQVAIYRNHDVLPRAFVVYQIEVVEGSAASLERVTSPDFDFRHTAVLEEGPAGWSPPQKPLDASAFTRIVNYEPNRVVVQVETPADGLLVLTDVYMGGWKASLDGQDARLYIANHVFRGVVVPAGVHRVEFVYDPASFRIGVAVSLATAIALIVAALAAWRNRIASQL